MKVFLALSLLAAAPADIAVPDLGWMSGSWSAEADGVWTEETWSRPRGNLLLGSGSSGTAEIVRSFEFMRIAPDADGRLVFWGAPGGKPAIAFPGERFGAREIVFLNRDHDYPQRIAYRRDGETLVATTSLADGSKAQSWRYARIK
ncbi:DUF6265 family protein [Allosphingosinicella deserti]|nr:DUF6265 family protein [Sphingomonas deserti]